MKTWEKADIIELGIEMTAYGRNYHAKEANADKHHNNGAGGSLNISNPDLDGSSTGTPTDMLS